MRNARSPCDGSILLFRFRFRSRDSRDFARTRDTALIPIRWIGHVEETRLRAPTRLIFGSKSFDSYIYINVWRRIRGGGDLMGIRPVDDFDETFDSKLAGDSINFSDFLF